MAWPYDEEIPEPPEGFEPEQEPFTNPPGYTDFTSGLAATFGFNDPEDTGVGAWGDVTNDPEAYGVSLSEEELRQRFGNPDDAHNALVEITGPNGNTVIAPIVDKGPAPWVIDRQGPTIDVTEGVRRDLGGTGMDPVNYRIIGHPPEGFEPEAAAEPSQNVGGPQAIPPPPEGFELEGLNIQDAIDPSAPYMSKPRDPGHVRRIIMHGDVNQDADALLAYGRQVDPERGFAPGYHFYIARDGTVKQGAPIDRITNHTLGENGDSIGIVIAGADNGKMPTPAQEASAKLLIGDLGTKYGIDPSNVIGHGELQPDRREALEGGTIARDVREQGYFGGGPTAPAQEIPPPPEGFVPEVPAAPGPGNRDRLLTAIQQTEKAGYEVPHFIGTPDEPEGDRGPTMDMEHLVAALRKQETDLAGKGDKGAAARVAEARSYWENEIKTHGMTAEQWRKQTGEEEPGQKQPPVPRPAEAVHGATPAPTPLQGRAPSYPPFTPENIRQAEPVHGYTPSPTPIKGVPRGQLEPPLMRFAREGWVKAEDALNDTTGALAKKYQQFIKPLEDPYVAMNDNAKAQKQAEKDLPGLRDQLRANQEVLTTYVGANMQDSKPMLEALGLRDQIQRKINYAELASKGIFEKPKPAAVGPQLGEKETTWQDKLTAGTQAGLPQDQTQMASHASGALASWLKEFTYAREKYLAEHPGAVDKANTKAFDEAQAKTPFAELNDIAQQMGLKDGRELKEVFRMLPRNIAEADPATAGKWFIDALRDKSPAVAALGPGTGGEPAPGGKSTYQNILEKRKADEAVYGKVSDIIDAKNSVIQGGTDKGLLMVMEGGYRMVEARTAGAPKGSWGAKLHDNAKKQGDEVAKMREQIRKGLPVEKEYAESFFGKTTEGIGQFVTMPAYLVPGLGQGVTVLQLYQEGREDYIQTRKQQGLPVDDAEADAAAWKYVSGAAPMEVLADKFIISKYLKGAHAKGWSIGKTAREAMEGGLGESLSEGGQQAWNNVVATGGVFGGAYDPRRPVTEGVVDAAVSAFGSGAVGAGGAHTLGAIAEGRATDKARADLIAKAQQWKTQQGPAPGPVAGTAPAAAATATTPESQPMPGGPVTLGPTAATAPTTPAAAPAADVLTPANEARLRAAGVRQQEIDEMVDSGVYQRPTEAAPAAAAPAAAAPAKPTEIKTFADLPQGLGTPAGGTTGPAPEAAAAAAAATTPAAQLEAESEAEARALMAGYAERGGAFGRAAPTTAPTGAAPTTAPTEAAPKASTLEAWATQPQAPAAAQPTTAPTAPPKQGFFGRIMGAVTGQSTEQKYYAEQKRIEGLTNQEVVDELGPEYKDIFENNAITKGLGIPVEYVEAGYPMAIDSKPDGTIAFHVSPRFMLALENATGRNKEATNRYLVEELIHGAETILQKEDWQNHKKAFNAWMGDPTAKGPAPKMPESFTKWMKEDGAKRMQQIRDAIERAPEHERKALYQAILDSYNAYYMKDVYGLGAMHMRARSAGKIFDEIANKGRTLGWTAEFVRQAKQLRDQGDISENTWTKIMDAVKTFYEKTVQRLKKALPGVYEGKFGPEVQQHLERIQNLLESKGVEIKGPEYKPTYQKGAQQKLGKAMEPAKVPPKPISDTTVAAIVTGHSANEGSSINEVHGDLGGTDAFQLSIFPELTDYIPGKNVTKEQIRKFEAKAHALGIDTSNPNLTIGTWYNPKTGNSEIDISITTSSQSQATALAKQFNQQAIFSLKNFETIQVGGTGTATTGLPSIQERLASLTPTEHTIPSARPTTESQQQAGKQLRPEKEAVLRAAQGRVEAVRGLQDKGPRAQPEEGIAPPGGHPPPSGVKHPDSAKAKMLSPGILKHYRAAFEHGQKTNEWGDARKILSLGKAPVIGKEFQAEGTADLPPKFEQAYKEAYEKNDWQEAYRIQKEADKSSELLLTPEAIDEMARDGEAYKKWYSEFSAYLDEFLGPDKEYAPLIKEFLAATSVQTDIKGNVRKTINEFLHYVKTGEIATKFKAHGDNLRRIVLGEQISGPKVGEYSPALHGDPFATTMDRHMFKIFFGNQNPTDVKRDIGSDQLFRAAARLGWGPTEVQAAMWGAYLARRGESVSGAKTYGAFLEQERQKLEEVFRREAIHGGRGIEAARRVATGIGERAGPERALREEAYGRAAEAQRRGEPTERPKPARKPKESAEAEAERKGARSAPIPTTGAPATGGPEYGKIGNVFKRRYKGMAQNFRESNSPALQNIGNAMLKHVDREAALKGEWGTPLVPRGRLWNRATASREFNSYWETFKEKGRVAADALPIGPEATRLVQVARDNVAKMNAEISRLGIKVYNTATGGTSASPQINEFPDILSQDTLGAIENRHQYQAEWERLKDAMVREGIIPAGPTPADTEAAAHNHAKAVIADYSANKGQITRKMPAMAFDRSLAGFTRFTTNMAERAALKEAFGTKFLTPGGGTAAKNVFDIARQQSVDEKTSAYIDLAESYAYGRQSEDNFLMPFLLNVGTATQLANIKSTLKNLYSGVVLNPTHLGFTRMAKQLFQLRGLYNAIQDGKEKGLLLSDLQNAQQNAEETRGLWEKAKKVPGQVARFGLKYQAYAAVEKVARGYAIMGANSYLRAAIAAFDKSPTSRASRQFMGRMQRLGFSDPAALFREKGTGPLTDTYVRRQVNAIQGGYTYADTPAYFNSAEGKFTLQYGKWGTEQAASIANNIVKPFVRMAGAYPETVSFTDKAGNKQTAKVPGEALPLIRLAVIMGGAGGGWEWFTEQFFGTKSRYASWNEIFKKASRGDRQALGDALGKVAHYYVDMGAAGVIGDKIQRAFDVASGRSTFMEAAAGIPSVAAVSKFAEIITDFFDRKDYDDAEGWWRLGDNLTDAISATRVAKEFAGAQMRHVNDIFGTDYRFAEHKARMQDMSWAKSVNARADAALGVAPKPRFLGGSGGTEESTMKEAITTQLMLGNAHEAKHMVEQQLKRFKDDDDKEDYMKKIKASVLAKQPLGQGAALRELRLQWAKKNLHPDQWDRLRRMDRDYRRNAEKAELMDDADKEPKEKDVDELRDSLKRAKARREMESPFRPVSQLLRPATEPTGAAAMSFLRGTGTVADWANATYQSAFSGVTK